VTLVLILSEQVTVTVHRKFRDRRPYLDDSLQDRRPYLDDSRQDTFSHKCSIEKGRIKKKIYLLTARRDSFILKT
jgi:hypothetical protein